MRYLCTAGKTRVGWYKDFQNKEINEITYVDYCKRQNATKPPVNSWVKLTNSRSVVVGIEYFLY